MVLKQKKRPSIPIPGVSQGALRGKIRKTNVSNTFLVICCPPHPHPRRQSKFPPGGKRYRTNGFWDSFCDLLPPPYPHPQRQSKFPSGGKCI